LGRKERKKASGKKTRDERERLRKRKEEFKGTLRKLLKHEKRR